MGRLSDPLATAVSGGANPVNNAEFDGHLHCAAALKPLPSRHSTPDPSTFRSYGHDANGSVEELQNPDGTVPAGNRYGRAASSLSTNS